MYLRNLLSATIERRPFLLASFILLLCLRLPHAVVVGRFWAEEGSLFYVRAAQLPWFKALLLPYGGYLNIVANAATIMANRALPLEYAPRLTMFVGLLFQCVPAIILVFSHDSWLSKPGIRAGALLIIATAPMADEVWLQSLHSQFHLGLGCAIILAINVTVGRLGKLCWLTLFLAPLCGPLAAALLPLFFARAAADHSRERLIQALFLASGTLIQVSLFLGNASSRQYGIGTILLLCVVYLKQIVVPLFGARVASQAFDSIGLQLSSGAFPFIPVLVSMSAIALIWCILLYTRQSEAFWFFAAACVSAWFAYFGAIEGPYRLLFIGIGERYSFVPTVLTALTLLAQTALASRGLAWIGRAFIIWLLAVGAYNSYVVPSQDQGPNWSQEVSLWRRDHSHPLAIWPEGWFINLSRD